MSYKNEYNKLLQNYLDRYEKPNEDGFLELIISSECNQRCEYCYLFKNGHKMYPAEANDKNNILHNLPILLEYLKNEGYKYSTYDIFSGEFFDLEYWSDIFDIIYNFHADKHHGDKTFIISIPTNASFLLDDEKTQKVEEWIAKFEDINFDLYLSLSVDGPADLESIERPLKDAVTKEDEFYHKLFKFMEKYEFTAHPIITRNFVKNYKQNYDFWIDNVKKYNCKFTKPNGEHVLSIPMFLEVRDQDQWDSEEALNDYVKFLWYMAEKDLKDVHNGNLEEFAYHMADDFGIDMREMSPYCSVQPYTIQLPFLKNNMPCSIQGGLAVRTGDLAIVPCHRTCYSNLNYGKFKLDDKKKKIIGVEANNPMLAYKIKTLNPNISMLKCTSCEIKSFCMKGCLGAQFEQNKELFSPIEPLCKFFKVKYKTIHEIAKHYGIYDIVNQNIIIPSRRREFINYARQILERSN